MAARNFDLEIEQGSDYEASVPVFASDDTPQDATGWTARGQIRQTIADAAVAHELDANLTVAGPNLTIAIPGDVSSTWAWREGVYDIKLTDPNGKPGRFLKGRVVVDPAVTR